MGQRQSTTNNTNNNTSNVESSNEPNRRGQALRPTPRTTIQRPDPLRRPSSTDSIRPPEPTPLETVTTTRATMTTTEGAVISPFSRMIAQVISQAVITSFRNGYLPLLNRDQTNVRQQLSMHLSSDMFRQIEPETTDDMFIRFLRLPVLLSRVVRSDEGEEEEEEEEGGGGGTEGDSRIVMLPVFLYGLRNVSRENEGSEQAEERSIIDRVSLGQAEEEPIVDRVSLGQAEEEPIVDRVSLGQAIANTTEQHNGSDNNSEEETRGRFGRQWTIYVIGGTHIESIVSETPSYEELLNLAAFIGTARPNTVSQESIDHQLEVMKYNDQVKQEILGNADKCQVCLSLYELQDDVRILNCHHGFHKECIDQWLTQGQNKCPLCRTEVVQLIPSS